MSNEKITRPSFADWFEAKIAEPKTNIHRVFLELSDEQNEFIRQRAKVLGISKRKLNQRLLNESIKLYMRTE